MERVNIHHLTLSINMLTIYKPPSDAAHNNIFVTYCLGIKRHTFQRTGYILKLTGVFFFRNLTLLINIIFMASNKTFYCPFLL